jgi:hypothetical protein
LIDTGDFYGMGHNELLIGEALKGIPRDKYREMSEYSICRSLMGCTAAARPRVRAPIS